MSKKRWVILKQNLQNSEKCCQLVLICQVLTEHPALADRYSHTGWATDADLASEAALRPLLRIVGAAAGFGAGLLEAMFILSPS